MTSKDIKKLLAQEVAVASEFENFHGITPANLGSFLIEPCEVTVDPDDQETSPRSMWLVLRTHRDPHAGSAIAFDPVDGEWAVVEPLAAAGVDYLQVCCGDTLAEALEGM